MKGQDNECKVTRDKKGQENECEVRTDRKDRKTNVKRGRIGKDR